MSTTSPYAVTTVAGTGATGQDIGASVDGAALTTTQHKNPYGVAFNPATGMLYISDLYNNQIRQLNTTTGVVSTLAGSGAIGGADGNGANAQFRSPYGVTFAANGDLLVSEFLWSPGSLHFAAATRWCGGGSEHGHRGALPRPAVHRRTDDCGSDHCSAGHDCRSEHDCRSDDRCADDHNRTPGPTAIAPPASPTVEAATATVSEPAFTG